MHKLEILFSLLLHPSPEREDFLVAELQECGTAGIQEDEDGGLRAFFEASQDAGALAQALALRFAEFRPELRTESSADWEQLTRDAWPPLCVGERFYLVAPWNTEATTPPGRRRLEIYPGMACGTGRIRRRSCA